MREYVLNPGSDEDEITLYCGHVPGRKSPAISVRRGTTIRVLGYLRDDDALEELGEILGRMLTTVEIVEDAR